MNFDKKLISEFIENEADNIYLISLNESFQDKTSFSIQDYLFSVELKEQKFLVSSTDEFLEDWIINVNKKVQKDMNIKKFLEICTKEFGILIGDDDEEELVFYSNVENDNYDMKFLDRVRFGEDDFNPDLFVNIFEFLPGNHLLKIRRVSKLFQALIEKDSLWERLIKLEDIKDIDKKLPLFKNFLMFSRIDQWEYEYKVSDFQYFYSKAITKGVQKLKVKMVYIEMTSYVVIGICNNNTIQSGYIGDSDIGYCYHPPGQRYHKGALETYGEKINTGDVITIIMDCLNMNLSFEVNGKNQGVAYHIEKPLPLYFCVCTGRPNDKFEIVK